MGKLHVRKGDNVVVLAGKDKRKTGRVLACNPEKGRVQVEDIGIIVRHKKARSAQDAGGLIRDAGFIHSSNVQIICPSCDKPTRVAHLFRDEQKYRACKHCSASLDAKLKDQKGKKKKGSKIAKDTKVASSTPQEQTLKKTSAKSDSSVGKNVSKVKNSDVKKRVGKTQDRGK